MKATFIMVTGGQRSGKSLFAEGLALKMSERPVYLATAVVADDEMRKRVALHQARRREHWRNIEETLRLSETPIEPCDTVLVDCLTLWVTNWFFHCDCDTDQALERMKREIDALSKMDATFIVVTNEIGLGGISENKMQRQFTDLQGLINQYVAGISSEVYFSISGIPVKIK